MASRDDNTGRRTHPERGHHPGSRRPGRVSDFYYQNKPDGSRDTGKDKTRARPSCPGPAAPQLGGAPCPFPPARRRRKPSRAEPSGGAARGGWGHPDLLWAALRWKRLARLKKGVGLAGAEAATGGGRLRQAELGARLEKHPLPAGRRAWGGLVTAPHLGQGRQCWGRVPPQWGQGGSGRPCGTLQSRGQAGAPAAWGARGPKGVISPRGSQAGLRAGAQGAEAVPARLGCEWEGAARPHFLGSHIPRGARGNGTTLQPLLLQLLPPVLRLLPHPVLLRGRGGSGLARRGVAEPTPAPPVIGRGGWYLCSGEEPACEAVQDGTQVLQAARCCVLTEEVKGGGRGAVHLLQRIPRPAQLLLGHAQEGLQLRPQPLCTQDPGPLQPPRQPPQLPLHLRHLNPAGIHGSSPIPTLHSPLPPLPAMLPVAGNPPAPPLPSPAGATLWSRVPAQLWDVGMPLPRGWTHVPQLVREVQQALLHSGCLLWVRGAASSPHRAGGIPRAPAELPVLESQTSGEWQR